MVESCWTAPVVAVDARALDLGPAFLRPIANRLRHAVGADD